jgi:hypothetical protein
LDYIRKQDEDSDDDEEAPEPEFNFSKTDAMAAVDLIHKNCTTPARFGSGLAAGWVFA